MYPTIVIDGEEGLKLFDSIAPDNMAPTLCFSTGKPWQKHHADRPGRPRQQGEILKALLDEHGGKVAVKLAKSECAEAGVTLRTIERAVKKLNLELSLQMEGGKRCYYWTLKTDGGVADATP